MLSSGLISIEKPQLSRQLITKCFHCLWFIQTGEKKPTASDNPEQSWDTTQRGRTQKEEIKLRQPHITIVRAMEKWPLDMHVISTSFYLQAKLPCRPKLYRRNNFICALDSFVTVAATAHCDIIAVWLPQIKRGESKDVTLYTTGHFSKIH